jgi:hypothetical protein
MTGVEQTNILMTRAKRTAVLAALLKITAFMS